MLKLSGISRSSSILGSDSPQSNNRKDHSLWVTPIIPREKPNVKHAIAGYLKATTASTSASTDAGAALAPLLSGGTSVRHWQSARRLWPDTRRLQLPLDDSIQQTDQIPNDPPQMGAKSTTTSNHPSTP